MADWQTLASCWCSGQVFRPPKRKRPRGAPTPRGRTEHSNPTFCGDSDMENVPNGSIEQTCNDASGSEQKKTCMPLCQIVAHLPSGFVRHQLDCFPLRERRRVRRYKFSKEIKAELAALAILDNWHGPAAVIEDVFVIACAITLGTAVPIATPLATCVIGSRMRALATLLHEATHRTLAANLTLNQLIGRIAGYSIFQTWEAYRRSHIKEHHAYIGNADLDPDLKFHIEKGLYNPQSARAFLWHHIIKPGFALNVGNTIKYLLRDRMFGVFRNDAPIEHRKDARRFIAFWCGVAAVVFATSTWQSFLIFWVLPYMTTFQIVNYFCELGEHFPKPVAADLDITLSRNRLGNWLERFFFGMHNEHLHLEHHLAPGIPFWNLPKARLARLKDPFYAALDANMGGLLTRGPNGTPCVLMEVMSWVAIQYATHSNGE